MGLCCYSRYLLYGFGIATVLVAMKLYKYFQLQRMLARWSKTPKDLVILHAYPPGKTAPNLSPFVMKVQTYLRMTNIPYKMDNIDYFGPKDKTPWMTLNGEHIADSHFIIQHLNKKFDKNLNGNYSEEQLAIAKLVRITLEEFIFWGGILYRTVYNFANLNDIHDGSGTMRFIKYLLQRRWKKNAHGQGMGRHTKEEVYEITTEALRSVSLILGNKKFILGDEPCEDDCAIFGMLAQCVWVFPGSPYDKLVHGELKNLMDYCERMKARYWPDWDQSIDRR